MNFHFLLLIFVYKLFIDKSQAQDDNLKICFQNKGAFKNYFPPETETTDDSKIIYSVENKQRISRPIVAYLCYNNEMPIKSTHAMYSTSDNPKFFLLTSLPANEEVLINKTIEDNYLVSSGFNISLCQHAANDFSLSNPRRFSKHGSYFKETCTSHQEVSSESAPLSIRIHGSELIAQGISHSVDVTSSGYLLRKLKFTFEINSTKKIHKFTHPFKIHLHLAQLRWIEPSSELLIPANNPFSISLEIVDVNNNNQRITQGLDSTLIVEVAASFHHKMFTREPLVRDFVYNTSVMLAGDEVITSFRNYDQILHKRAVNGLVEFDNISIQEVYFGENSQENVILNATLLVPRTGERQPMNYADINPIYIKYLNVSLYQSTHFCDPSNVNCLSKAPTHLITLHVYSFTESSTYETFDSVKFSKAIAVKEQEADRILIIDSPQDEILTTNQSFTTNQSNEDSVIQVSSHFEIPNLWIMILDKNDRRIFSGWNSKLIITVSTIPQVIISNRTIITQRGIARYMGAICETEVTVRFQFTANLPMRLNNTLTAPVSRPYKVVGDIQIAFFGHYKNIDHTVDHEITWQTFAQFAANDVTNNHPIFKNQFSYFKNSNHTIKLNFYDTELNPTKSAHLFIEMMETVNENKLNELTRAIAGFGSDLITLYMRPLLLVYKMPILTFKERRERFIRDDTYKTLFSLSWNDFQYSLFLGCFLKLRQWNYIINIEDVDHIDYIFKPTMLARGFLIVYTITIQNYTHLSQEIKNAKKTGAKIVICHVSPKKQYWLLRQAINNNFSSIHGYQWLSTGIYNWATNDKNCIKKPTCSEAFEGMLIFKGMYNLTALYSKLWYHNNRQLYEMNPADSTGIPTARSYPIAGEIALGYDVILCYAFAFDKLIRMNKTITTDSILQTIQKINFHGLTGRVRFAGRRWRAGLAMNLFNVVSKTNATQIETPKDYAYSDNEISRLLVLTDYHIPNVANDIKRKKRKDQALTLHSSTPVPRLIEIPLESSPIMYNLYKMPYLPLRLPNEKKLVANFYLSTIGYMRYQTLTLTSNKRKQNLNEICLRTELIIPAFYCEKGCGGGRLFSTNAYHYKNGACVQLNECRCLTRGDIFGNKIENSTFPAYTGKYCKVNICLNCQNGVCTSPFECTCLTGWSGKFCTKALCPDGCLHGICLAPNYCKCYIGYQGKSCQLLTALFLIILLVSSVAIVGAFFYLFKYLKKKKKHRDQMLTTDWIVDWSEVKERALYSDTAKFSSQPDLRHSGHKLSTATSKYHESLSQSESTVFSFASYIQNVVIWKERDFYVQKFNRSSVDITLTEIRREIILLKEIKHRNLIEFFGFCPTYPNVALFTEVMHKESLDKILKAEVYDFSWSFKFSILRDIVKGMEYLHSTKLASHGRLKSSNCLVDNKWTCKVSGFGIPSIRKVKYSDTNLEEMLKSMLWTAPELLRICPTPNEVKTGTKLGDVYSFGIIFTECITHEHPYSYELQMLSVGNLLSLLRNFQLAEILGLKKILEVHKYDTASPIRPAIKPSNLPKSQKRKKAFLELILRTTAENPMNRPSFTEIAKMLNALQTLKLKSQTNENIYLLEKYTRHLNEIINVKSIQIKLEKNKTEELTTQLLPTSIAKNIKEGCEITPKWHNNVSILCTNIVGFTDIIKDSSPIQAVALLNDLYICFDNIFDIFDVYKFDTRRDIYCVASGIPDRNPNHFEETATMALFILSAINSFPAKHKINNRLQVRIGIHSGSCGSGIVNNKILHYCIFGTAITIAQNMESQGQPFAIQISEPTAALLDSVGGYNLIYRKKLRIKSVGTIPTYWLVGKLGITLPSTPAISFIKLNIQSTDSTYSTESEILISETLINGDEIKSKNNSTDAFPEENIENETENKTSQHSMESDSQEKYSSDYKTSQYSKESDGQEKYSSDYDENDLKPVNDKQ